MSAGQWLGIEILSLIALTLVIGMFRTTRGKLPDPKGNEHRSIDLSGGMDSGSGGGTD